MTSKFSRRSPSDYIYCFSRFHLKFNKPKWPSFTFVLICLLSILAPVFVPVVSAAGIWRGQVSDYQEPTSLEANFFSTFLRWLKGSAANRPPIGTTFTVIASAYAPSVYQTDSTPCITAAGTRVRPGVVASNFLPFGTLLDINSQQYIVEDRMNARYQGKFIDIWFPSTALAQEFGRQTLHASIIGYGTPGQPLVQNQDNQDGFSVIHRSSLRFIAATNYISSFLTAKLSQQDINCFR